MADLVAKPAGARVESQLLVMPASSWQMELAATLRVYGDMDRQAASIVARRALEAIARRAGWQRPIAGAELLDESDVTVDPADLQPVAKTWQPKRLP
jgi:hypothetical protein